MNAENDYIRAGQRGSLDDSPNAGKAKRSKSMGDLDSKEIEMLSEFVTLSLKIGYTYIQEGICDFQQWSKAMKDGFVANTSLFTVLNLTNAEVDKFIEDTWNSPFTMDGETKLLKEWAFVQKIGRKSDTQCIKENDISSNQKITDNSIPRDENGEYLFTQVPAEQTYAYLNAQEDLTPKEVEMFVNLNIQKAQKRIKKLESKRPKTTSDLNEYLANKAKWEVERQQAQADFDYWNQVKAIRKGKKARCHSKISFNRTIVWLLSFLLLFFIALILFLNQRTDQKEESLNEENSCAYSVVSNFVKYQVITKDGKRRGAKKSDVEKYGWSGYAKAYPGAKVRMKDNDNRDYAVPIDKVDYASGEGLRLFTIQVVNIAKHQPKSVGDKVIKYQITMEDGKVHNVSKTNIEKYGWRGYAEEYPGATVRMRDVNNEDYDVPIDKVEYALSKNFRLFSIQFDSIKNKKFVLIHSNGDVTMDGKKGQVVYSFTLPDGRKGGVSESGVKKHGWDKYAKLLKGAKVDMKDNDGNRYMVPLDIVNDALTGGLLPFTTFVSDVQWNAKKMKKDTDVDVSKWLTQKAPEQLLYQVICSDGTKRTVRKSDAEKYGWAQYASDYPGYSLCMRDKDNKDFFIPFGMVEQALIDGFKPYVHSEVIDKAQGQLLGRPQTQEYDIDMRQWLTKNNEPEKKEALVQTSQDSLFTFAESMKYMPYVVIVAVGCILAVIWFIVLKTKKKRDNKVDVKTNTFSIKTSPTKKQMSQRSLYMKKGFYYLILILLWMLCVLLMGLLFILFSMAPVVSWSYSIGIACAQPFVWLISLGIVLLLRPFVYKFMFKEKKAFSRTIAVVLLVFGVLFMIFKIGNAIYSRHVMDQLIENYDWESKYGQSKDEIFKK